MQEYESILRRAGNQTYHVKAGNLLIMQVVFSAYQFAQLSKPCFLFGKGCASGLLN